MKRGAMRAGEWFGLLFLVAVLYVLVRPRSGAAQMVAALGKLLAAIVRRATDMSNT